MPFWPLDPGSRKGKKSGSGSGMNNSDHISKILKTLFWVKIRSLILCCGSGLQEIRIRDKHPRSATLSTTVLQIRIRIHRIHMFLGLTYPDPDPLARGWIRILLLSCKNSNKNLVSYCLVTLFDFLSLKNDVNIPSKSNKQKIFVKKLVFCWNLKVNDENSRIRIRIRINLSEAWIRGSGSGSTPKCHGPRNTGQQYSFFIIINKKYCTALLLASISSTTTAMIWPSTARCRTSPATNQSSNQSINQSINKKQYINQSMAQIMK